ncbi:MAG: sulfatase-like hydrolase/transferase, partial [Planctomycetales bacterium]|nr:sulfatase-like hydrolase/transferase [Planctomycetales bacterium]
GFDRQYGHFFGMIDNYTHMRDGSHDWYRDDHELREEGYSTHLLTREACRIVREQPQDKPLFLYIPYNAVHTPLQVPEKYLEPYGNLKGPRRQLAGMLAAVDEGIGQIVTALNEAGMSDNTLIIFSSDNGGPKPGVNQPLSGYKGSVMEGGVRGCAFATWPGKIPAKQRIAEPVHIIDWYPTLIQLAGGSLEQRLPIDGRDIWPTLTTQAPTPHDAILLARSPERVALRMGDWKLVRETAAGPNARRRANRGAANVAKTALYNLASDIGETTDLKDEHRERFTMIQSKLTEFLKDAVPPGDSSSE